MQILKPFPLLCAAGLVCLPVCGRAADYEGVPKQPAKSVPDSDAQAKAREALRQAMSQTVSQPTNRVASAPTAPAPKPKKSTPPPAPKVAKPETAPANSATT